MSIRYEQGNLLEAQADALVNTVNEIGVMGKGIALQFREAFPENAREYEKRAREGSVHVGHVLVTARVDLLPPRWILHFPTKKHWRQPSRLEWIRQGLSDLKRVIEELHIHSIALPPLGCGNGGLEWAEVRPIIEAALGTLPIEVVVFEPTERYYTQPKTAGVSELTPPRAMIVDLVRRYSILGIECTYLEVHKLAWLLQSTIARLGVHDPLEFDFRPRLYGPYSDKLRHLLDALDGSFLHSQRRLADERPRDPIWCDEVRAEVVERYFASPELVLYRDAVDEVARTIEGFESPLGMEALATVDWLANRENVPLTVRAIKEALGTWPGGPSAARRKLRIFDDRLLGLVVDRLSSQVADDVA